MAGRFDRNTRRTALGGVLAAGSLAVLWLACIAPTGSLGVTAVAGLFPMVAVVTSGRPAGFLLTTQAKTGELPPNIPTVRRCFPHGKPIAQFFIVG